MHITSTDLTAFSVDGSKVSLQDFKAENINFRDIAHHLALINVLAGATELPISFAQLSLIVARFLSANDEPDDVVLAGLVNSVPLAFGPLRARPGLFLDFTSTIHREVLRVLGLASLGNLADYRITTAHNVALNTIMRDCSRIEPHPHFDTMSEPVKPLTWLAAETAWLQAFENQCRAVGIKPKGTQ